MSEISLASPDGLLAVRFAIKDKEEERGVPVYSIDYKGTPLILESCLGLELEQMPPLLSGFEVVRHSITGHNGEWRPIYGERDRIPDHYNGLELALRETAGAGRRLHLEFRAYNEGVAFRYAIPEQPGLDRFVISAERSQFHFPEGCIGYEEHGAEGEYHKVLVKDIQPNCERPLTVEYPNGTCVCLTEAALNDYSRMLLRTDDSNPWIVVSQLSGLVTGYVGYGGMSKHLPDEWANEKVAAQAPFATPWRVLIVGDRPGDLLERNYLVLNLNEPCALDDTSWIVPGKAIRDVTLSTEGGKACVDFAVEHRFKYVLLDWGWYGDPYDEASDATKVPDKIWRAKEDHPGLDLQELIRYAAERGIGIFLYLDRRAVENQIDRFLPVYKEWGVKGIKIGFVNTGPQKWTKWLMDTVRKCAEYGILVNVHDAYRPTGFSRTYPNWLTQEGIRGNEHMPTARHNATLPFTRFPAGAGDYTICYYTDRIKTTHAHQLAMSVVVYSPLQLIFWYDKPSDYRGEPEVEFFDHVPTVWNETKVIHGKIGEYAVIARRSGDEWYIGAITNERGRELSMRLDFLDAGRPYIARIYADDMENAASRTKVSITVREVNADTVLHMLMAPSGGQAIRIVPKGWNTRSF
jgi:alpha-glucosidase